MAEKRTRLSDEGEGHKRQDPTEDEMEIDAANDRMGGPTTESLSAGLPSTLRTSEETPPPPD